MKRSASSFSRRHLPVVGVDYRPYITERDNRRKQRRRNDTADDFHD